MMHESNSSILFLSNMGKTNIGCQMTLLKMRKKVKWYVTFQKIFQQLRNYKMNYTEFN